MSPGLGDGDNYLMPDLGGEIGCCYLCNSLCIDDCRRLRWRLQESGEGNAVVLNGKVLS